jgi:hypothetical protein
MGNLIRKRLKWYQDTNTLIRISIKKLVEKHIHMENAWNYIIFSL